MNEFYPWQQTLWQQVRGKIALKTHALLLKGKKGIGKLVFARHLAKSLLCEQSEAEQTACGVCSSCRWFEQGIHPNFFLMEPGVLNESSGEASLESSDTDKLDADNAKTRKKPSQYVTIDQVRAVNDFVYLSGHQDKLKVILIHPAEALNMAAANALLKKLEEPPIKILFILVTHRPQELLPTIRSRCQQISMPAPDLDLARNWLIQQGITHPDICLALAGSSPLQAVTFEQHDYLTQHADFIQHIGRPVIFDPIMLANKLHKKDLPEIVNWLQKWCYDLMSYRSAGKIRYHVQHTMIINKLAATLDSKLLASFWRNLITYQQLSHHPLNTKLFLEDLLLSYLKVVAPNRYKD